MLTEYCRCSSFPSLSWPSLLFLLFSFFIHPSSSPYSTLPLNLTFAHLPTWMTFWASPGSKRALPTTTIPIRVPTVLAWPLAKSSLCLHRQPPSPYTSRWASPRSDSSPPQPHPTLSLHHSLTATTPPASLPRLQHRKKRMPTTSLVRSCPPLARTPLQESLRVLTPCRWTRDVDTTSSNNLIPGDH